MKNRFRSHAAAAMLLLPLGLAVVAEPAAAQQRAAVAQSPLIERFVVRPMGRLHAGQELRFRVSGEARSRVWVDIPGVVSGLQLAETRPGVYEGTYTIRGRDDLDAFGRSAATLQSGNLRQTARVEQRGNGRDDDERRGNRRDDRGDDRFGRDDRPPQISELAPAQGTTVAERNRVRISARLADEGRAGVDPASVALRIDGRDVTRAARITETEVEYREDLRPGRHTAELTVRDRAGNTARRNWSFDVAAERQAARAPALQPVPVPVPVPVAPLALQVTSHANEMVVNAKRPITIHGRTAPHAMVRVSLRPFTPGSEAPVTEQTVRADASGNFSALLQPLNLTHTNLRVDVLVTSTLANGATVEQRLKMRHSG
jgi:hypothetical protein